MIIGDMPGFGDRQNAFEVLGRVARTQIEGTLVAAAFITEAW